MHSSIPLALVALWCLCRCSVVRSNFRGTGSPTPTPWWLWENITEAVEALEPEQLEYQRPHLNRLRINRNRERNNRPRAPPSALRTAPQLLSPTTNVSELAAELRFYVCCICVPEYACTGGVVNMKEYVIDDYDINYVECPYESDVCCSLEETPEQCRQDELRVVAGSNSLLKRSAEGPAAIEPECECLPLELCPTDLVVRFSPDDPQSLKTTCEDQHEVCCSISDLPSEDTALRVLPFEGTAHISGIIDADSCVCVEQSICDITVHLLGIKSKDYLKYVKNEERRHPDDSCPVSTHVCCSLPPQPPPTTDPHPLLLQSPAITYSDDEDCYGYFITDKIPATDTSALQPWQAQLGELPWGVLLLGSDGVVRGAGALVHPRVVLTVAHPFGEELGGVEGLTAMMGVHDRSNPAPPLPGQEIAVGEFLPHPQHTSTPEIAFDVGLMFLQSPAVRTPNVQTVCLAESLRQVDRGRCVATGWGVMNPQEQQPQDVQKRVLSPVVDKRTCEQQLRATPTLGEGFQLHNSSFCAGGTGNPGLCIGDQGGPLTCPSLSSGRYVIVGALSGGVECGAQGVPDIFSSFVGGVTGWVRSVLKERFGRLEEPLPRQDEAAEERENGVGTTAGSFYFEDEEGKEQCQGYEYREVPSGGSTTLLPHQAQLGELPWGALLLNVSSGSEGVWGAGALVHPRVVLTTATRVLGYSPAQLAVVLGEWDRTAVPPALPRQDHAVQEFVIHPQFNETILDNNIALIILAEAAVNTPNVQSICMTPSLSRVDRTRCVATGWGIPNENTMQFESIQKRILVPMLDRESCVTLLRRTPLGDDFNLLPSFYCGGGVGGRPSTCMGDEGAPLACPRFDGGGYFLVGALAGGFECGVEGVPDVYKSFMDESYEWVRDTITRRFPRTKRERLLGGTKTTERSAGSAGSAGITRSAGNGRQPSPVRDGERTTAMNRDHAKHVGKSSSTATQLRADVGDSTATIPFESSSRSVHNGDRSKATGLPTPASKWSLQGSFSSSDGTCAVYQHPGEVTDPHKFPLQPWQTHFGEAPWGVLLQGTDGRLRGAGALLLPRVVITAASVVTSSSDAATWLVVMGAWDRQHPQQQQAVERIVLHPHYSGNAGPDLALLVLKDNAVAAPGVQSVCLARSLMEVDRSRCVATGWGAAEDYSPGPERLQKRVFAPVLPQSMCEPLVERPSGGQGNKVPPTALCGGGFGGVGMCAGDGGAPLVCPSFEGGHYLLVGLLSERVQCGVRGVPDLYASVVGAGEWVRWAASALMNNTYADLSGHTRITSLNISQQDKQSAVSSPRLQLSRPPAVQATAISEPASSFSVVNFKGIGFTSQNTDDPHSRNTKNGFRNEFTTAKPTNFEWTSTSDSILSSVAFTTLAERSSGRRNDESALGRPAPPRNILIHTHPKDELNAPNKKETSNSRAATTSKQLTDSTLESFIATHGVTRPSQFSSSPLSPHRLTSPTIDSTTTAKRRTHNKTSSSFVPSNKIHFKEFQHYAQNSLEFNEKVFVEPFEGSFLYDKSQFVSPSYSSIVQFRPRRLIEGGFDEMSPGRLEEEECVGYEDFGTGGDFDAGISSRVGQFGEFPWAALVLEETWQGGDDVAKVRGTGALIHPRVVVTAAHVVARSNFNRLFIRLGEWSLTRDGEPLPHQQRGVRRLLLHPQYDSNMMANDIALIILQAPASSAPHVQPVCLAPSFAAVDPSRCLATGWGRMGGDAPEEGPLLKRLRRPLLDGRACLAALDAHAGTEGGRTGGPRLHRSLVCTVHTSSPDDCLAAAGTPLLCPSWRTGQYMLVGVQVGHQCPPHSSVVRHAAVAGGAKGGLHDWVLGSLYGALRDVGEETVRQKVVFRRR